jgi:replication initiation protein RepC
MQSPTFTAPFGRRPLTLAQVSAQAQARARAPQAAAHKWQVFRALCASREKLGLSERSLAVLNALLSFHPETVLSGDRLIVFPSNAQLCLRAHGMAASTLRRHLAALVEAGLVIRRDSPNGKRYARKGQGGEIGSAFGFDLSPLVARADEFAALAETVEAQARTLRLAKERLTLARRDLAKAIAVGLETQAPLPAHPGMPESWTALHAAYRRHVEGLSRQATLEERQSCADALTRLAAFAVTALETHAKTEKPGANESRNERHKQDTNSQSNFESEKPPKEIEPKVAALQRDADLTLPLVLSACPDIADYTRCGVSTWPDLLAAAGVARAAIGVSPNAWEEARRAMGERAAAAALAAILQRGEAIASPGGYLRALTRKAANNEFALAPMLTALLVRKQRGRSARAS